MELNKVYRDTFILTDSDGDPVTGETANITISITQPDNNPFVGSISKGEIGGGEYYFSFTPNLEGTWTVIAIHPVHAPNKASGYAETYYCNDNEAVGDAILDDTDTLEADLKTYLDGIEDNIRGVDNKDLSQISTALATIQSTVDAILEDTDTVEADLKTYIDTIEDNIRGLDDRDMTVVYDYITSVKNDLIDQIDDNEAKIDIIDGIVDAILEDTSTTIPTLISTSESNIRGADSDTLKTISDQMDEITPLLRYVIEVPPIMYIPVSGTTTYRILLFLFDSDGNPEAPDSLPTIKIDQPDGTPVLSLHDFDLDSVGVYHYDHTFSSSQLEMVAIATITIVEGGVTHISSKLTEFATPQNVTEVISEILTEVNKLNTDNSVYTNMEWENKRLTAVDIEYYSDTEHETLIKTKAVRATYNIYGALATKTETTTYE